MEVILLESGVAQTTTIEYGNLHSDYPQMGTIEAEEMAERFLNGSLPLFDGVVSFSSLEHSGLGRYGDSLSPHGDLIAMAQAWCVVKPGGYALVAVPTDYWDHIEFNYHRIYGPIMFPHLFANWLQVHADIKMSRR